MVGAVVAAHAVGAQEAAYLTPDSAAASGRAVLRLRLGEGEAAAPADWRKEPVRWVFVKTTFGQENRDSAAEWARPDGTLSAPLTAKGATMIGVDFEPVVETVRERGGPGVLRPRLSGLRVRHHRSASTVLLSTAGTAGEADGGQAATAKAGLACEVRPYMDVTQPWSGGDLILRAYVQGAPAGQAPFSVRHAATGRVTLLESDANGFVRFTPEAMGVYEVLFYSARRLEDDAEADYDVFSTSLTFTVRGTGQ